MPSPKITIYFTPDIRETGRIPINDIKFSPADDLKRGRYQIDLDNPCLVSATCTSHRSAIKSTASITIKSTCFGEKSEYVFKTNDYFEIWDTSDTDNPWCYFRGVVQQPSRSQTAEKRSFVLNLENAGGWLLGDNAVYYLGQLIITQGQVTSNFFNAVKVRYGWADSAGKETAKGAALDLLKVKTPAQLLETLVNKIGNERVKLLKSDFYENQDSIKPVDYVTGEELSKGGGNKVFVVDKLAEMEGSILNILSQFEGRPFAEIFMFETKEKTKVIWRNSRWRDSDDILCMGDASGKAENIVSLYTDPRVNYANTSFKSTFSAQNGYLSEKLFSGFTGEETNKTTEDVVNAFYVYPVGFDTKKSVPNSVIAQIAYDEDEARQILDLDSVIRHGYRPIDINLPFIPDFGTQEDFSKKSSSERAADEQSHRRAQGAFMLEYTKYLRKMFKNIQNSGNGQTVMQNNLQCTVADDYRIFRTEQESPFFVNMHRITWLFNPNNPKTIFEWDRGFERPLLSDRVANSR